MIFGDWPLHPGQFLCEPSKFSPSSLIVDYISLCGDTGHVTPSEGEAGRVPPGLLCTLGVAPSDINVHVWDERSGPGSVTQPVCDLPPPTGGSGPVHVLTLFLWTSQESEPQVSPWFFSSLPPLGRLLLPPPGVTPRSHLLSETGTHGARGLSITDRLGRYSDLSLLSSVPL